jgi:HSP20 family molecular chaperone IbpA
MNSDMNEFSALLGRLVRTPYGYRPSLPLAHPHKDVNLQPLSDILAPQADVVDSGQTVEVYLDMPGVAISDVVVEVRPEDNELWIAGKRTFSYPRATGAVLRERKDGEMCRVIMLDDSVDCAGDVNAEMSNGVLKVVLHKLPASVGRRILVQPIT